MPNYAEDLVAAGADLVFFVVFSTILASLFVPPERLGSSPRWFRALALRRRSRSVRAYYATACLVFMALALLPPVLTLLWWSSRSSDWHLVCLLIWLGVGSWLAVLGWVLRYARPSG